MNFNSGNNGQGGPPGMNQKSTISKINEGFNTKFSTTKFQNSSSSAASSNSIEFSSTCSVCADIDPKFWSVSPCGHKICWICSLKMRALYNSKACPICKSQSDSVFIYENESVAVDEFFKIHLKKLKQPVSKVTFLFNESLSIGFENEIIKLTCEKLLLIQCPFNHNTSTQKNFTSNSILPCTKHFKTKNELRKHIQTAHDLLLCEICFEHKKVFTVEFLLFNRSSLQKHQREANHPRCQVCNLIFYSDDELYEHCRDEHEQCHICKRAGVPNRHFQNYARLEEHFQSDHFLCPELLCRDLKFVVFESELEYKAHQSEVHLSHLKMQRSQQRQLQRLNISFDSNTTDRNNNNSSSIGSGSNSNNNNNKNNNNSLKLTNDQRNQISVNLVYGEVTDDLANRLQSLNLYQTRNDEFIESLRGVFQLNQNQIQNLLNSARAYHRNESSATEFLIKIESIVEDERITLEIVKGINELQLDEMRKQRLNVAIHQYQQKCSAFPELASTSKRGIVNNNNNTNVLGFSNAINRNGNDSRSVVNKGKAKDTENPFGFARTRTLPSSNTNNNNNNISVTNASANRTVKVLQILKSGGTSNPSNSHYNNSSSDPSQNPSLLLSQLAGGPNKNYKSPGAKKLMMPLSSSGSSKLGSFSSVALSTSTSTSASASASVSSKIKSKNSFNTTKSTLDNETFPSLIKGKDNERNNSVNTSSDVNNNNNTFNTTSNTSNTNNTNNTNNAFFAPSDRDQLESFTIGNEIEKDNVDEEGSEEVDLKVDSLKKKKTKKVVFRYGQKWDI